MAKKKVEKVEEVEEVEEPKRKNIDITEKFNMDVAGSNNRTEQLVKRDYTNILKGHTSVPHLLIVAKPEDILNSLKGLYPQTESWKKFNIPSERFLDTSSKSRYGVAYVDLRAGVKKARYIESLIACHKNKFEKAPCLVVGDSIEAIEKWLKDNKIKHKG